MLWLAVCPRSCSSWFWQYIRGSNHFLADPASVQRKHSSRTTVLVLLQCGGFPVYAGPPVAWARVMASTTTLTSGSM